MRDDIVAMKCHLTFKRQLVNATARMQKRPNAYTLHTNVFASNDWHPFFFVVSQCACAAWQHHRNVQNKLSRSLLLSTRMRTLIPFAFNNFSFFFVLPSKKSAKVKANTVARHSIDLFLSKTKIVLRCE